MTTTQTETTTRLVAKCRSCKTAHAEDMPAFLASEFFYFVSISGGGHTPHRACKNCGRGLHTWNQIKGKFNPTVKCNDRCESATGPSCECSCGGHNHGAGNL